MTITKTILALVAGTAFLIGPANAGGPVITEEQAPPAVQRPDSDIGQLVVPLLLIGVVAAIVASQGDNCIDEPVTPDPEPVRDRCR